MNPAVEQAVRQSLAEWRAEAGGSLESSASYRNRAARLRQEAEEAEQRADEHDKDKARAVSVVAQLEEALRAAGLEP